jgi:hypothetical protein
MENNKIQDLTAPSLFSIIIYGLLIALAFIIIIYNYGKYDISLARSFKNTCQQIEDKIKTLFYKFWLSMKMKGDAIKVNYNEYNILDNSLNI